MTGLRSRRHRAGISLHAAPRLLRALLGGRAQVAPALQRRYRTALAGGLGLALVAGVSAAAIVEEDPAATRADLTALGLEVEHPAAPGIAVPETEELELAELAVDVELGKSDIWHLREAEAAARNAERQALEEQRAAESRRQQAARTQAEQPQQSAAEQPQQSAAEQPQQRAAEQPQQRAQAEQESTQERSPAPQVQAAAGGERGSIASLVNNLRGQNGLSALGRDGTLDSVAQGWAEWMAANQVLQHNPSYKSQIGSGWSRSGENIVRNTGAQSWSSGEITSWMFNWWANSAPHRANMLNGAYTHVGVGYAMGSGGPYAVLVFGGR